MDQRTGCGAVHEIKPMLSMILCQVASGGVNIFYKLAVADGMKIKILVVYRLIFATIFIAPIALVFERKTRPKFTWMIAFQGFACGLLGPALASNLYAESLVLTSATFAAAMANLIPALTLLMSVIFRLERLEMRRSTGKAKVLGTALGIGGAMVLTIYKGSNITLWSTNVNLLRHSEAATQSPVQQNLFGGSLLALCSCISYAAWLIVQTKMSQSYPCYSSTALTCFIGAIMAGAYCMCRERQWTEWKLGWNIRLLASAYTGIIGTGMVIAVTAWGTWVRGPLYVSSFSPLALIFVAMLGSLILDEKLHFGSMIGSVLIIVGLYMVLWGKSKEMKMGQSSSKRTGDGTIETTSFTDRSQTGCSTIPQLADHRGEETSSSAVEEV
ncbi:hypothetical protein Pfo_007702 [Paulownia fortunei]|nr:hypothetical protein Pfo_007702 [Paulownia fortunei]